MPIVDAGADDTITVSLHGQGSDHEFARFSVRVGITAAELARRVAGLIGNTEAEFILMNLGNPMYLYGAMRITRDTRIAVRPNVRGG